MQIEYPMELVLAKWDEVNMGDRSRHDFGNIEEMAQDIKKNGLTHPPTVAKSKDPAFKYELIGGERRMKAMQMLGLALFPVNVREELEEHQIREMELMENFHRKQMTWQEECILIDKTHRAKVLAKAIDMESWGMRETGKLLGCSASSILHATTMAPYLKRGDAEILMCGSMFAAYELLLKRQEDLAASLATKGLNEAAGRAVTMMGFTVVSDDVDEIFGGVKDVNTAFDASRLAEFMPEGNGKKIDFDLLSLFRHGDCLELMPKVASESVDHVVTDPPYGIDLGMMPDLKNIENVRDTHEVEQNILMFEPFLYESFRIIRPAGYCVFWYDISHHEKLQSLATKMGYKPQRWPIVWHKLHPCLNNAPRTNFTKNVEFAMVLRKSTTSALVEPQVSSLVAADGAAERKLYDNPFSKPLAVWRFILNALAYKGQVIYDPYAGQCSSLRTVINMGMIPMGCEIDENHYNRGLLNMQKLIKEING